MLVLSFRTVNVPTLVVVKVSQSAVFVVLPWALLEKACALNRAHY